MARPFYVYLELRRKTAYEAMAPKATGNRVSDDRRKESTTPIYSIDDLLGAASEVDFNQPDAAQAFQDKYAATLRPGPEAQTFKTKAELKAELKKRPPRGSRSGESDNVLHKLSANPTLTQRHKALVKWLIKTYPGQLKRTGEDAKTPLYKAIDEENLDFVRLVLDGVSDPRALLSQTVVDSTCLFLAIQRQNPFTCVMIQRCLETLGPDPKTNEENDPFRATVSFKDWAGSTPLHIAVYIEPHEVEDDNGSCRCTLESVNVTEVADVNREAMKPENMSPVKLQPGAGKYDAATWRSLTGSITVAPNGDSAPSVKIKPPPIGCEEQNNTYGPTGTFMPYNHVHVIKKLIEADKRVLVDCTDVDGKTPFQVLLNFRREKNEKTKRDKLVEGHPILVYMRAFIIENFGRNDAMKALYGSDERESWFIPAARETNVFLVSLYFFRAANRQLIAAGTW